MNDVSKTIDTSRQADIHIYLEKWNSADTPQWEGRLLKRNTVKHSELSLTDTLR